MNAPTEMIANSETILQPAAQLNVALDLLTASPTNPRKRFDAARLEELAQSIRAQGVLQPLLVRENNHHIEPAPMHYEIIAGERRYRAAKLAGLAEVPCVVRNLTDQQVLHAQVIENLQRDDLHPLEEAEGYERLMQERDAAGNPYTAENIGAEIGKSRAYIYARIKLLALCAEARDAFYGDTLDASTALLIARIPVHKLQLQALKDVTRVIDYSNQFTAKGDKISFRRARELLQEKYMLDLDRAPFDIKDAALLPKAGSCIDCTKRTGNQPELFDDVGSKNVCTDPSCHALKKTAHILALQKSAEAEGKQFISGKAAKKLIPSNWGDQKSQLLEHGYATLTTIVPGDKEKRTYAKLLKEAKLLQPQGDEPAAVVKVIVENPHKAGQTFETVNIEQAIKALREAGYNMVKLPESTGQRGQQSAADRKKQAEKNEAELAAENSYRSKLFDAVHQRIEAELADPQAAFWPTFYRMLAEFMFDMIADNLDLDGTILIVRKYIDLPAESDEQNQAIRGFLARIKTLTTQQHIQLLADLMCADETVIYYTQESPPQIMLSMAKELGLMRRRSDRRQWMRRRRFSAVLDNVQGQPTAHRTDDKEPSC